MSDSDPFTSERHARNPLAAALLNRLSADRPRYDLRAPVDHHDDTPPETPPDASPSDSLPPQTTPSVDRTPAPVMRYAAPWESVRVEADASASDSAPVAPLLAAPSPWLDPWNVASAAPSGEAELLARDAAPAGFAHVTITIAPPPPPEPEPEALPLDEATPDEPLGFEDEPLHPDDDQILQTLAAWLAEVRDEADALAEADALQESDALDDADDSEALSPLDAGRSSPARHAQSDAFPPVEAALADEVASAGPGLLKLVEEFTALRHDVKLQTKSARGQGENVDSLVTNLRKAIDTFQATPSREETAVAAALRPLFEALVDLDSSFDRGRVAAENARARLLDPALFQSTADAEFAALPFWKKKLLGDAPRALAEKLHAVASQAWTTSLDAQVDGYRMIQNRLRRFLAKNQVEKIETVGLPVDPNTMTVIDVGDHPALPPGTVMDELRAGYRWRGQVLRFAEVKAVRAPAAGAPESAFADVLEDAPPP